MSTYGQETYDRIGSGITVTADGAPIAKAAGVTVDWESVVITPADTTYFDEDYVVTGERFLRYGTVICKILTSSVNQSKVGKYAPYGVTTSGADTITVTNAANGKGNWYILNESVHESDKKSDFPPVFDGGRVYKTRLDVEGAGGFGNEIQTITLGVGNSGGAFTITFSGQTTGSIVFNALGSAVEAALIALSNVAPADVTVAGVAGGPYTVTFSGVYANTNVPAMTTTPSLTGGANTATVQTLSTIGVPLADFETAFPMIAYVSEN